MRKLLIACALLLGMVMPAAAQNTTGLVVSVCGSPPFAFKAGNPGPFTIDTNGNFCSSFAGGTIGVTGTTSNASSGVAATSTNIPAVAYMYAWNGATWDQYPKPNANGQAAMAASTPVVIASDQSSLAVIGNIADGATDSGNSVKIGCLVNTTGQTALVTGQRTSVWCGGRGNMGTFVAGLSGTNIATVLGLSVDSIANTSVGLYTQSFGVTYNGSTFDRIRSINNAQAAGTGTQAVAIAPTSSSSGGITPVVSGSAEATHVLKASAGNLYSVYATNLTATAGFLTVINATSAPGDGAQTPLECVPLPANGNASINYSAGPPSVFSTGITAIVTSANTCFTKTTGVITAFIKGSVQ